MDVRGELIRQLRQQRGWTQQQLAEIADLSLRTVQRVENQGVASNESISALSAVMELPREEILTPSADPEVRARAERQAAWMVPVALTFGVMLGSGGTFMVMFWLGG